MSLTRFKQIKRSLHDADHRIGLDRSHWHKKPSTWAKLLQRHFHYYFVPAIKVTIDQIIVSFCCCSLHTVKVKNTPIKYGYKIFALCSQGYIYGLLWYSLSQGIAELVKDH